MDEQPDTASNEIVYVLTNPAMPGYVKIGRTKRGDVSKRVGQLYNTSVPLPFECVLAVRVKDAVAVERTLHAVFAPQRVEGREFFEIDPDQAVAALGLVGGEDVTPAVSKEADKEVDSEGLSARNATIRKRGPNLKFPDLGIPKDAKLRSTRGGHIVTVASDNRVLYEDDEYSLSAITRELMGPSAGVYPSYYWTYQGTRLRELYVEKWGP